MHIRERKRLTMNSVLKRWVATLALVALVWSGAVWVPGTAAAATSFGDVKPGHWAEKHITKLAHQKLLQGGTNGLFYPNNAVTREESIIIALRFLGVYDQANESGVTVLPAEIQVQDKYKHYINMAIKQNIIIPDEEVAVANAEPDAHWGKSAATRGWLTRLLVRTINQDAAAKAAASKATSFSDDAKISSAYRGYVNVGVEIGLIKGIAVGNRMEFQSDTTVSRATASTLFSRAQKEMSIDYAGERTGVIWEITDKKLTMVFDNGSEQSYAISDNTPIYRYDSESAATLADLRLYGKALVIVDADGNLGYIEQTNDTPQVKTYEGKIIHHSSTQQKIILLVSEDKSEDLFYDASKLPTILDADGKPLAIKDLPLNVPVKVTVDSVRQDGKVLGIAVTQKVVNKTSEGTIVSWDAAQRLLQVKDEDGNSEQFKVAANATIKLEGINQSEDRLTAGTHLSYEVKQGEVTSIVLTPVAQKTVKGTFTSVDIKAKTIQYVADKLEAQFLAERATVIISGMPDATLDDLVNGDAVTLTLNDDRKVTTIEVTNRSVQNIFGAVIGSYAAADKTLIVYDAANGNAKHNLDVTDNTRFDLNGTILTLAEATPHISAKGKRINVGYTNDTAVYVSIVAKYTGVVIENNTVAKNIKLSVDGGSTITLPYALPYVEIFGKNNESYTDVKAGDKVTLLLSANQDQIGTIQVHTNAQFDVVRVDATGKKLRTQRANGVVDEWTISDNTLLKNEDGNAIKLSDIPVGALVNVVMQGDTLGQAKIINAVYGKIATVNTTAGTIEVVTSTGATVVKTIGSSPIVMRGTSTSTLASLKADDRVEVRKNENDRTVIEVIAPQEKKFWRYVASTRTISMLLGPKETVREEFVLHPQAYIHKGATTITAASLNTDDVIVLYVLRGQVVELEKK